MVEGITRNSAIALFRVMGVSQGREELTDERFNSYWLMEEVKKAKAALGTALILSDYEILARPRRRQSYGGGQAR